MAKRKTKALPRTLTRFVDPLNINGRLYNQLAIVLDELEKKNKTLTWRDRITALVYIGRIQTMFMGLRKEQSNEPTAGSAVRKYADAFKANAARGRKTGTGPAVDNDWDNPDFGDPDSAA